MHNLSSVLRHMKQLGRIEKEMASAGIMSVEKSRIRMKDPLPVRKNLLSASKKGAVACTSSQKSDNPTRNNDKPGDDKS